MAMNKKWSQGDDALKMQEQRLRASLRKARCGKGEKKVQVVVRDAGLVGRD